MRRNVLGTAIIAALLVVISITSGFAPAQQARAQPSDVGIERSEGSPIETGEVRNPQSYR